MKRRKQREFGSEPSAPSTSFLLPHLNLLVNSNDAIDVSLPAYCNGQLRKAASPKANT
jgi:hypothetical protein